MKTNKKGFTIIEVVLVLAIAGLIFLMVFIALPALQRSQRNTQREDDIARFLTAVNDYQTNNSGQTPFTAPSGSGENATPGSVNSNFVKRYIEENIDTVATTAAAKSTCASGKTCPQFTDPDGEMYKFVVNDNGWGQGGKNLGLGTQVDHVIYVVVNAGCGTTEGTFEKGTGDRQIAMFYIEEVGATVCNDNH